MPELDIAVADLINPGWISTYTGTRFGTTPPPVDRNSLVTGNYEPSWNANPLLRTVGILGDIEDLDEWNSPATNSVDIPAGTILENKIIYGDARPLGAGEAHNCLFVGGSNTLPSGNLGCLRCVNARSGIFKCYDCTFDPRQESNGRDCVLGWQYELYRCHLRNGVDGAGIYHNTSPFNNAAVKVHACLIEDLVYIYPDNITTSHSDGTHNDCIQIQGGNNIDIFGNSIRGSAHKLAGTGTYPNTEWLFTDPDAPPEGGWINGSGIIIQKNIGSAPAFNSTTQIRSNYFRWCKQQLTIKSTANGGWVCTGNKFSTLEPPSSNSNPPPSQSAYWIRFDNLSTCGVITGLVSSTGVLSNTSTNVWLDGPNAGDRLTTPRASGVQNTG